MGSLRVGRECARARSLVRVCACVCACAGRLRGCALVAAGCLAFCLCTVQPARRLVGSAGAGLLASQLAGWLAGLLVDSRDSCMCVCVRKRPSACLWTSLFGWSARERPPPLEWLVCVRAARVCVVCSSRAHTHTRKPAAHAACSSSCRSSCCVLLSQSPSQASSARCLCLCLS